MNGAYGAVPLVLVEQDTYEEPQVRHVALDPFTLAMLDSQVEMMDSGRRSSSVNSA